MAPLAAKSYPEPPPDNAGQSTIASGEILYNRYCSRCHVLGRGVLPDLRRLTPEKHQLFSQIVLNGALQPLGMGRFDDVLNANDARAIHAYIIHEAWKARSGEVPETGHTATISSAASESAVANPTR